ncbi:MAG: phage tail tape measure protein [Oscillospiraceae bacterium]|jgi:phage-related protein|nr:phage tail tape measure protein [Oscillospiraceae bacterium]
MPTIGLKLEIDGDKEYKQALTEINSSMKVLRSEMAAVSSEFGKNEKTVESAAAKNKVLTKEIDTQKDKISMLKDALNNSAESFGENDKKTQGWQTKLNYAQADLNKMEHELDENNKILESNGQALDENSRGLNEYGENANEAGKSTKDFGQICKEVFTAQALIKGIEMVSDGVKKIVFVMKEAIVGAANYADEMLALSVKTGISAKTLQEFSAVQELINVGLNTFTSSISKNTKSMANAQKGTGETARAYKRLGISVVDSAGNLRSTEKVFWESIDALGALTNETERDAVAMTLFGKSAQELNPLIVKGSKGFAELSKQAHEMGLVLEDDALNALGNLDNAMNAWNGTIKGITTNLAANLAPELSNIINSASQAAQSFGKFISSIGKDDGSFETNLNNLKASINNFFKVFSESETTQKILGWGLILAGGIIALAPLIGAAVAGLMALVTGAVAAWPIALGAVLIGGLVLFWPQISKLFSDIWSGISRWINTTWENIKSFLSNHWQDLLLWIFAWPVMLIKALSDFWPQISNFLSSLWANISNWFSQTFVNIINWFSNLKSNAVTKSGEIVNSIVDWFKKLPGDIWNAISGAITKVSEWGTQLVNTAKSTASNIYNAIINGLKNIPNEMVKIGNNLVQGLWNGINGMINWIKDKVRGFANSVTGWLKNFFGISSPSRLFRDQIGKNLALGLGEGFTDEMKDISKHMEKAVPTDFDMNLGPVKLDGTNLSKVSDLISNLDTAKISANSQFGANEFDNGIAAAQNNSNLGYSGANNDSLVLALQNALSGMAFKVDGDKIGELVISEVERVIYS